MRTLRRIIAMLRRHQPKHLQGLLDDCCFPLLYLGSGAYRNVYEVVGSGYVVKLTQYPKVKDCIGESHAETEFKALRDINSKPELKPLRPFMPRIEYFNSDSGITVMPKYNMKYSKRATKAQRCHVTNLTHKLFENDEIDLHGDNWAVDARGRLKVIDLGYFTKGYS